MATDEMAYLTKARTRINKDPQYRKLGNTDLKLALVIGKDARLVTFTAFEVESVEPLDLDDLRDAELVLRMGKREWNAYLKKRRGGTGPSLLTLDLDRSVVEARDPLARLKLERYNRSLQSFVDACAKTAA